MATVEILTTNFSGETAQITFTPCSGGTIDLGTQVLPYDYVSDNYEGSYSFYFPDFTKTCTFDIPCSTNVPTPTPTYSQTVTPTYSQTVTPTYSQTVTPTYSQTITPTIEATATPTPTYSQTVTPTIEATATPTPTYSQTITLTLTPTYSQTVTPTYSQTVTPTHSQTVTPTYSQTVTPTPTPTPISETPCDCYTVECINPEGCELSPYEDCNGVLISGFAIAGSTTTSICGNIINLEQPNLIIRNTGRACFFDGEIYTCLDCECATINIDERDLAESDDGIVYVDMIKCDGTGIVTQYDSVGIYTACVQVINDIYTLKSGTPSAPLYSTAIIIPGTNCTVDNDCGDIPTTPTPTPTLTLTPSSDSIRELPSTPTPTPTPTLTPTPVNTIQFLEGSDCYGNKMGLHQASTSVCQNIQGGVGLVNYYMSNCDYQTVFVNGNPSGCQVYINDGVTLVGDGFLSDGCRHWEIQNGVVVSTSVICVPTPIGCCTTGVPPEPPSGDS
jgi:hypothetical protein